MSSPADESDPEQLLTSTGKLVTHLVAAILVI
jgi:hypothetical protein